MRVSAADPTPRRRDFQANELIRTSLAGSVVGKAQHELPMNNRGHGTVRAQLARLFVSSQEFTNDATFLAQPKHVVS